MYIHHTVCRFGEPSERSAGLNALSHFQSQLEARGETNEMREKTMTNAHKLTVVAMALMMVSGVARAQDTGAAEVANQKAPDRGAMCRMDEHINGQLAYIKAELKITEAQESQWSVFAGIFREEKEKQARACKMAQEQSRSLMSASLPESMKMMAGNLAERLESLRAMEAAVQPLYTILSKAQRKTADEIMKGAPGL